MDLPIGVEDRCFECFAKRWEPGMGRRMATDFRELGRHTPTNARQLGGALGLTKLGILTWMRDPAPKSPRPEKSSNSALIQEARFKEAPARAAGNTSRVNSKTA